jgi:hypothetical protein
MAAQGIFMWPGASFRLPLCCSPIQGLFGDVHPAALIEREDG